MAVVFLSACLEVWHDRTQTLCEGLDRAWDFACPLAVTPPQIVELLRQHLLVGTGSALVSHEGVNRRCQVRRLLKQRPPRLGLPEIAALPQPFPPLERPPQDGRQVALQLLPELWISES